MKLERHYGEPEKTKVISIEDNMLIGIEKGKGNSVMLNFRGHHMDWYSLKLTETEVERLIAAYSEKQRK